MTDEKTEFFDQNYMQYDKWYEDHPDEYEDQVEFIAGILPEGNGVEIGVGTGRFAARLGIKNGVDISEGMVELARERGIDAILGDASNLPYRDREFDYSLNMVTICFLDDPLSSIREARRVSRIVITVILDRESPYVQELMERKDGFYRYARFYNAGEIVELYLNAGFKEVTVKEQELATSDGRKYRLAGITGK